MGKKLLGLSMGTASCACGLLLVLLLDELNVFSPPEQIGAVSGGTLLVALVLLTFTVSSHLGRAFLLLSAIYLAAAGYEPIVRDPIWPWLAHQLADITKYLLDWEELIFVLLPTGCIQTLRWEARVRALPQQHRYNVALTLSLVFTIWGTVALPRPSRSPYLMVGLICTCTLALVYLTVTNIDFARHLLRSKPPVDEYVTEFD